MAARIDYIQGESFFHRLHPLTKLAWAVSMCIVCFASSSLPFVMTMVATNVIILMASGVFKQSLGNIRLFCFLGIALFLFQALLYQ